MDPLVPRSSEELSDDEDFRARPRPEARVPRLACPTVFSALLDKPAVAQGAQSRREFLAWTASSLALAGISGCGVQPPPEKIVPYVRTPEELVPGRPLFFATATTLQGIATGVLVESHEGRPTKIEGNPQHPGSLGAVDAFSQASLLSLYDPDRSQNVKFQGGIRTWEDVAWALRGAAEKTRGQGGAGLCILTESVSSPTLAWQIRSLLPQFPRLKWYCYEPAGRDAVQEGARLAFGQYVETCYRFQEADVVLSLDADFLTFGPGHLRYAREFIAKRRGRPGPQNAAAAAGNRLYVVECMPTATGAKADHRWPLRAGRMEAFARALAAELDGALKAAVGDVSAASAGVDGKRLAALARDLKRRPGRSVIIAGQQQPPSVHLLAHAMNHALGNVGKTIVYTASVEAGPGDHWASLNELTQSMAAGRVETLVISGGNPVFTAPVDLEFAEHLKKVPMSVHLGMYEDETAALCHWHVPETHALESWSDARAHDGTASILQPLIAPLFGGKTAHELLGALAGPPARTSYEIVRQYWREAWQQADSPVPKRQPLPAVSQGREEGFEEFWRRALHSGVVDGTAFPPKTVALQKDWGKALPAVAGRQADAAHGAAGGLEIVFRPDPTIFDGRFANNGWLQELPKPLTKLAWDSAALMSPATAEKLGFTHEVGIYGGEHGGALWEMAELQYRDRGLQIPVWVVPGHADDAVTLTLGYGRTAAGRVGKGLGFNAYALRTSAAAWFDGGLVVRRTAQRYRLACTQYRHGMEGRELVRVVTRAAPPDDGKGDSPIFAARKSGQSPAESGQSPSQSPAARPHEEQLATLYPEYPYQGYKWGMAIDLTACVGCNACVMACQAENNSPVVGKDQVYRGRVMHWLRIDRYHAGGREDFQTYFQPVPCMHCENAPCELVCPVEATVHDDEGLNAQVYNRCVGTRYCSHNCPYKVRRFNFYQFADYKSTILKMLRNPNVTVRSRGVMEKCTYCLQRISQARIQAEKADRAIRDGEILTACQAACPAEAIVFGNLNDPQSEVVRWKADGRNYGLLAELNTRPRTTYLAVLSNPNDELRLT